MAADRVGKTVAVSILFDTVSIEIICGDDYAAEVLYDDIVDRLRAGQKVQIDLDGAQLQERGADEPH